MTHTLQCSNCSANLPITGEDKVIVCEYCGTHNAVPRELWLTQDVEPEVQAQLEAIAQSATSAPDQTATTGGSRAGLVVLAMVLFVAAVGGAIPIYLALDRPEAIPVVGGGPSVGAIGGEFAGTENIVPSWPAADGFQSARSIEQSVRKKWTQDARLTTFHLFKVPETGLMDLESADAAHMALTFYDSSKLTDLIPGETQIKGAQLIVSAQNNRMGMIKGDASAHGVDDLVFVQHWPKCTVADIWKSATEAGYPEKGFASIAYPEVPHDLTRKGIDFKLSFVRKDGKKLKKKLEAMDTWDTGPYHYVSFYIPNYDDAAGLTRYFHPDTCKPVDVDAVAEQVIDDLRAR